MTDVYYKLYKDSRIDNRLTPVCMQEFDEINYNESELLKDSDGIVLWFESEQEAIDWMLENVKEEMINPQYLKSKAPKDEDYFK